MIDIVDVPVNEINGEKWLILKGILGNKVVFRAASIEKKKGRFTDASNHRVDEAHAEGGVKCRPKCYDISQAMF